MGDELDALKKLVAKWGEIKDDHGMAKRRIAEANKKVVALESERQRVVEEIIELAEVQGFFKKENEIFFTYRGQLKNEVVLEVSKATKTVTSVPGVRIQ